MPGDESKIIPLMMLIQRNFRSMFESKFYTFNTPALSSAYAAVKTEAHKLGIKFDDPKAGFTSAYAQMFGQLSVHVQKGKLPMDLKNELKYINSLIERDAGLRRFRPAGLEISASGKAGTVLEKTPSQTLDSIVHGLGSPLKEQLGGEYRMRSFFNDDPRINTAISNFMIALGAKCADARLSPTKDQVEGALGREFPDAGAKMFMTYYQRFENALSAKMRVLAAEETVLEGKKMLPPSAPAKGGQAQQKKASK